MKAKLMALARTLHVYLTMLGVVTIVFFAFTGFVLNHSEWFGLDKPVEVTRTASIDAGLLRDPLRTVEAVRTAFGIAGALHGDVQDGENEVRLAFRGPGRKADVTITKKDGSAEALIETSGVMGRLGDLHKGTSAGTAWKWVMDVTAVLIVIGAVTGIVLSLWVKRRRVLGAAAIVVSVVVCAAVYWWMVP